MRAVVQRVAGARVRVADETVGEIGPGLLVLIGVREGDLPTDAEYLAEKIAHLRVMADEEGRLERSVLETGGAVLAVSQFTLYGDVRKGRRPSYVRAARGENAAGLYEAVCDGLRRRGLVVATGRFGAAMRVEMDGDGPVTILIDSEKVL